MAGKRSRHQKLRYIGWSEYGRLVESLAKKVSSSSSFDVVIGIARGGLPVALVVADRLGAKLDVISVKSYTGIAKRGRVRIVSKPTENIKGKRVLLVDDLVDEGDTMLAVLKHLRKYKPRAIKTAVVFRKPWSKAVPDYWLEVASDWIVFPLEREEVRRLRASG